MFQTNKVWYKFVGVLLNLALVSMVCVACKGGPTGVATHTISVATSDNGTILPLGKLHVDEHANQDFAITPNSGYEVTDVKVDGSSIGPVSRYTFINVTGDHTISATFSKNTINDGIYIGIFSYKYRLIQFDEQSQTNVVGNWTAGSFRITATLKMGNADNGIVPATITHAICSDPAFGTGLSGVTVDGDALLPDDLPTTPMNSSHFGGINIKFPNGALIEVTESQGISVTSGGMIISNSLNPAVQDATYTVTYVPETTETPWSYNNAYPYLDLYMPGEDPTTHAACWEIAFTSWSLTKSALSTGSGELPSQDGSENASGNPQSRSSPTITETADASSTGGNHATSSSLIKPNVLLSNESTMQNRRKTNLIGLDHGVELYC